MLSQPTESGCVYLARDRTPERRGMARITIMIKNVFIPETDVEDAVVRMNNEFIKSSRRMVWYKCGTNLDGISLNNINSIIKGFESTIGRYGIRLDHIGWGQHIVESTAKYERIRKYEFIVFQEDDIKNFNQLMSRVKEDFIYYKGIKLNKLADYLKTEEVESCYYDCYCNWIITLTACNRWMVNTGDVEDALAVITAHEGGHAIYHRHSLDAEWEYNVRRCVGNKLERELKCATVSEYAMSSMEELFAEVCAAVTFNIEINNDVKQAYLDTVNIIRGDL